jgi:Uma2 family endonuclease
MATTLTPISERERLARLCHDLGDIPLERIRRVPAPGSATEADLIAAMDRDDLACELVDGTLVEKAVGYYESMVAVALIRVLGDFVERHDLGLLMGEAATLRLWPGLVRMPDVSFVSWSHFPERELPAEPAQDLAPDL